MSNRDRAFLDVPRREPGYRDRAERLKDWRTIELPFEPEALREQAARCMDCGIPFCHGYGCPLENLIPEFNALACRGRWSEAWDILSSTDPLAEFTAALCPALCEGSCVAGLGGEPVAIRQIERMVVEQAFRLGLVKPCPPAVRRKEAVAIVGSGPAGLAAAWRLNRKGYRVTVFDMAPKPGGILRYGIPDFKLEKNVVDRRIRIMMDEGIEFENGVEVGRDVSARYVRDRFDATVLTGGAREPRDLTAPGRDLNGVHFAMPYLAQQNRRADSALDPDEAAMVARDRSVAVIGGGDTGSDCVGTALRQGARRVYQFEIMPKPPSQRLPENPWPEWPIVLREAAGCREICERRWSVMTRRLEGRDGRVSRLHACEVEWKPDASGRPVPREIAGSDFTVDVDMVLLAMGFTGPGRNRYAEELGLERDQRGFISRDESRMTSESGVFIAGDMALGASLVVKALADGARVAQCVDAYLRGKNAAAAG